MKELLFEIGCEEIPADDLLVLPEELKRIASQAFESQRLIFSNMETFATPRRLCLKADLEEMQKELRETKMGPPKKIALDASGTLTAAGLGFAKNAGISSRKIRFIATPKGEYASAEIVQKGRPAKKVLKELIPSMISQLPFRKFMKWGDKQFVFGRPIRFLLLLFGGELIRIEIAGVPARNFTFGHRFLGNQKIQVASFSDYQEKLRENGVVLKFEDRANKIAIELLAHANAAGGKLKEDPELLKIMANEVEFPEVLSGTFPPSFLQLPQEILRNAMRKHQKYFCALDSGNALLPVFFTVLNNRADNPEVIRQGHERVLQARLRDAEFFWNEDRKITLISRVENLQRLTYQEALGSYKEKIVRMRQISANILHDLGMTELQSTLEKLVDVSKVDLMTLLVGEFPELQGTMAGLYAKEEGYPEQEWKALYEQYQPVSAEDPVPGNSLGALLSLVDRIEVMTSGFVLNRIPTGSKDPYALRRIATGAVKIIMDCDLDLDLKRVFEAALPLYSVKTKLTPAELRDSLLSLMQARFRFLMEQEGVAHDYLNAILNVESKSFVAARAKARALWRIQDSPDLKTLARVFKRINNIIFDQPRYTFDAEILHEDGEIRLHRAFSDLEFRVRQHIDEKLFDEALEIMVTLGPEIDNFFDEVLVMTDKVEFKQNRIALLQQISDLYRRLADFSALQIEI